MILYASIYNDVSTIVNLSGRFDLKRGIEERIGEGSINRINKEGYLDVKDKCGMGFRKFLLCNHFFTFMCVF